MPSVAWQTVALDACDSTNDEARRLAAEGAPDGTVVWARRQLAGRGRRGRSWVSPEGNLHASLILRPAMPPADAARLSFVAALAVGEVVAGHVDGRATLKWPNDVLVAGRKISGILLESEGAREGRVDWVVLGVGINVRHHPPDTERPATSLAAEGAGELTAEATLAQFLDRFRVWYDRYRIGGFAPIRAGWLNAAEGLGGDVSVRLANESFAGRFVDLDEEGALVVETGAGLRRVTAGDVFFG